MSIHDCEGFVLITAAMEAIYQIAKPRVLDRYPDVEPLKCSDGYSTLHAWHFERPDTIQEEIYEECHLVAKEVGSFFDTEAYKAFDRLGQMYETQFLTDSLIKRDEHLRTRLEKIKMKDKLFKEARSKACAEARRKGGK